MQKEINKRIIFNIPGDTTLVDILEDILRNNGLTESDEEYFNTSQQGKEPRLLIIRDAMLILIQNKVPEKKLASFLSTHLKTSPKVAEKIIEEIKEKLLPSVKEVTNGTEKIEITEKSTDTQKILLEKIQQKTREQKLQQKPKEEPLPPGVKKPKNTNVEQNAKLMEKKSIPITDQDSVENKGEKNVITVIEKEEKPNPLDTYREPIE